MTNTKQIISTLIKKAFDSIKPREYWRHQERVDLITTARAYGLDEDAEEMETRLN